MFSEHKKTSLFVFCISFLALLIALYSVSQTRSTVFLNLSVGILPLSIMNLLSEVFRIKLFPPVFFGVTSQIVFALVLSFFITSSFFKPKIAIFFGLSVIAFEGLTFLLLIIQSSRVLDDFGGLGYILGIQGNIVVFVLIFILARIAKTAISRGRKAPIILLLVFILIVGVFTIATILTCGFGNNPSCLGKKAANAKNIEFCDEKYRENDGPNSSDSAAETRCFYAYAKKAQDPRACFRAPYREGENLSACLRASTKTDEDIDQAILQGQYYYSKSYEDQKTRDTWIKIDYDGKNMVKRNVEILNCYHEFPNNPTRVLSCVNAVDKNICGCDPKRNSCSYYYVCSIGQIKH